MVKKLKKNVSKTLIGGMLIFSGCLFSTEANAMDFEQNVVEIPCVKFENTTSVSVDCSITKSGITTVKSETIGKFGKTTKIVVTLGLQKYNSSKKIWSTIKTWSKTGDGATSLTLKKQYQLTSSGKYRGKLVAKVWNGSSCETVTTYSSSSY